LHDDVFCQFDFRLDESGPFITFGDNEGDAERFGLVPQDYWDVLDEDMTRLIVKNGQAYNSWLNINGEGKLVYLVDEWVDFAIRLYLTCLKKYVDFDFHDEDDKFFDKSFELPETNHGYKWRDCFDHEIEPVLKEFGLLKGQSHLEAKINRAIKTGKIQPPIMNWG